MSIKKGEHFQWIGNFTIKWKFLPWTHEIPPQGGIPHRLGTTDVQRSEKQVKNSILFLQYAVDLPSPNADSLPSPIADKHVSDDCVW